MDRTNNVVELRNVAIYHSDGDSRRIKSDDELVLSDVNLTVASGELVYFIGRVGSGKALCSKLYMPRFNSLRARVALRVWICED